MAFKADHVYLVSFQNVGFTLCSRVWIHSPVCNTCMWSSYVGMHEVEMAEEIEMAEEVEMAGEACASLPSALPQPCAQDGGTQVAPHAVKKRKRGTHCEGEVPHCNTGQSLLPHVTFSQSQCDCSPVCAAVVSVAA